MMPSDAFECKLFILVAFLLASITQSKMNQWLSTVKDTFDVGTVQPDDHNCQEASNDCQNPVMDAQSDNKDGGDANDSGSTSHAGQ